MAATLLPRAVPLFRVRLAHHRHHFCFIIGSTARRPFCSAAEEPTRADGDNSPSIGRKVSSLFTKDPPYRSRWQDPDFRKWKDREAEILEDIEPIIILTKEILHSNRYLDGERLTPDDEKAVVEKLLKHHPHAEDKIGCGLDSIMVDRHPQFRNSRCLFVVRTDGGWIDFSYQKCLRAYLHENYPSHAERFINDHLKRGS